MKLSISTEGHHRNELGQVTFHPHAPATIVAPTISSVPFLQRILTYPDVANETHQSDISSGNHSRWIRCTPNSDLFALPLVVMRLFFATSGVHISTPFGFPRFPWIIKIQPVRKLPAMTCRPRVLPSRIARSLCSVLAL